MSGAETPSTERLKALREQLTEHLSQEFPHLTVDVEIRDGDLHVDAVPA